MEIKSDFILSADTHGFNVTLAKEIGLIEAILLQHFYYWHQGNKNNPSMLKDGRVWTFRSISQIAEDYPYLSQDKVRGAIDRLEKANLLIKGNYNNDKFKRACWYSLSDISLSLFGEKRSAVRENPEPFGKIPNHLGKSRTINYNNNLYNNNIINNNSACAREEEFIERFRSGSWIADCCMTLHTTKDICEKIFEDFVNENKFKEMYHEDFKDFRSHFLNYTKIQLSKITKKKDTPAETKPRKVVGSAEIDALMYGEKDNIK